MKIKIINEFKGWKSLEITWLLLASFTIIGLSVYWKDSIMGIISATTGVICVILTGKGKLSAYLFGLINVVLYAIIAYKQTLYGETMLNLLFYLPMQFIGFYLWSKNMNNKRYEVKKFHMKNKKRLIILITIILGTIIYGIFLKYLGDEMPFVDSFTTVSSVTAMIVSVKMYSEQWWIWIMVDIFSVYMWYSRFSIGQDNIATLLMWIVYLLNAIIMCYKWEKEALKTGVY